MRKRGSGILLHLTSLPSSFGVGDLGPGAYRFADFLSQTKQGFWQVLPLNPINPVYGNSPYSSPSAFGGNTLLISPDLLLEEGRLTPEEVEVKTPFAEDRADFQTVIPYKEALFEKAFQRFRTTRKGQDEFEVFCSSHETWLDDFSLFAVIKRRFEGRIWYLWPGDLRDRKKESLDAAREECREQWEKERFLQYLFYKQWGSLKEYCNRRGIQLLGDLPIHVNFDSADVWAHPEIFKLDEEKRPSFVSGVPPDCFSRTGQLWGNPVYRWDRLRETGFEWWITRVAHHLRLFDAVRIDHFRGLVAYWEIPAGEETAIHGRWAEAPVAEFFKALLRRFFDLPIIAEDLGLITPDVRETLHQLGLPGMKVLLFAFGEDHPLHPYLPHMYENNCVVYTGTHDNNTVRGWFEKEASSDDKRRLFRYLGRVVSPDEIHWEMVRLAMVSAANTVIFPLQDILGLGEESRMNRPATAWGNWEWRLRQDQLTQTVSEKLLEMTETYGRE